MGKTETFPLISTARFSFSKKHALLHPHSGLHIKVWILLLLFGKYKNATTFPIAFLFKISLVLTKQNKTKEKQNPKSPLAI